VVAAVAINICVYPLAVEIACENVIPTAALFFDEGRQRVDMIASAAAIFT